MARKLRLIENEQFFDAPKRNGKRKKVPHYIDEEPRPRYIIAPRTPNQGKYIQAIRDNDITFGFGSAGSGKTFLAAAIAAQALDEHHQTGIRKIVICRPLIEAGEKLGFLPGGIDEKTDPYLRPMYDAFEKYWGNRGAIDTKKKNGIIEIVPLAYMRGRTFEHSFILADECQNASADQLIMLMTRLGEGSKMVITGDPQQRDKRDAKGWEEARIKLTGCPNVAFIDFGEEDIVRHQTVKNVLERW